jgi:inositol oxygenase
MFCSEGQWDVVGKRICSWLLRSIRIDSVVCEGDTFVVGCKFSEKNIYPETFDANPDSKDLLYSSEYGIYQPKCGLDNVMLSWGHDEVRLLARTFYLFI